MPDMREKVKEYIVELEEEMNRLTDILESSDGMNKIDKVTTIARLNTLIDVENDLQSRLDELI